MSLNSPEEAGANTRSPDTTPDYEHEEEAKMMLDKAEVDQIKVDSRGPRVAEPIKGAEPCPPRPERVIHPEFQAQTGICSKD